MVRATKNSLGLCPADPQWKIQQGGLEGGTEQPWATEKGQLGEPC